MMRKSICSLIIALLVFPVAGIAQNTANDLHFDVRVSMSAIPEDASDMLMTGYGHNWWPIYGHGLDGLALSDIYHDYNGSSHSTNTLGTDIIFHVSRKWDIGMGIYCNHLWYDTFNGVTDEKTGRHKAAVLYLMPAFRRNYMVRDMVRLYGQVSVGVVKHFGYDSLKYSYVNNYGDRHEVDDSLQISGQFVPLGIEVGRKWFGFGELGFGGMFVGVCLGAGYKF